jgi:opine dehydrogenase
MIVVPAVGHREMASRLGPHLQDGQVVLLNPGRTGGALEFATVLREQPSSACPVVAEAQTLLYASRDIDPASVRIFSVKNAVPVAALPAYLTPDVLAVTGKCLPYFVAGDNVLKTGLSNIGAIFHPALTLLNAAWIEERHGDFDYYLEGASPSVAQVLEAMDGERVAVASALGIGVPTAREWLYLSYGATGKNLYEAIQANPGYIGIKAPNRLEHRYLTEDVPMSLVPMASLGDQLGVPTLAIKAFVHLASLLHQRDYWAEGRTVDKLGLNGMTVAQIRRRVEEGLP